MTCCIARAQIVNNGRIVSVGTLGTVTVPIELVYEQLKGMLDRKFVIRVHSPDPTIHACVSEPFRGVYVAMRDVCVLRVNFQRFLAADVPSYR